MRKTFIFITIIMLLFAAVSAQTVTLTFTGRDASNQYIPLNRVVVSNLTRGWQETLFWPDTVLVMTDGTGIDDFVTDGFHLSQNNPNPFNGTTYVNLSVTEPGDVSLVITDITGRIVGANNYSPLQPGIHEIRISLSSAGIYFLTARQNGRTSSVKMVNSGNGSGNAIAFTGTVGANDYLPLPQPKNAHKGITDNLFLVGDQMQYAGFTTFNGIEEEGVHVIQTQDSTQMIVLSFPQPCQSTPIVMDYDSNVYNTVQIGNQCWMKENLRTTHYADGTTIPYGSSGLWDDTVPYYYVNPSVDTILYGYYYNWAAFMHGAGGSESNPSGIQGACPTGWHVPSNAEWIQLIDYVSSRSEYTCGGQSNYIAKALAFTEGWNTYDGECVVGNNPSTNNATGFGIVPAGFAAFSAVNDCAYFWSSSERGEFAASFFALGSSMARVSMVDINKHYQFSVRCLRD